ncbi:MAG: immunity 22 family protein [Planctomycetaceae bacterium]
MKVSVWTGNTTSWEVLDGQLTFAFTKDGDAIPSRFCEAFDIDWFDDDFREASHSEIATLSISELLKRHSHGERIADALGERGMLARPCNTVVLLYEFEYSGAVHSATLSKETNLRFMGCVEIP